MASRYGSWVGGDDWRAYVEIALKTEDATTGTFTVKAWLQSGPSGASSYASNIQGWAGIWDGVTNGYRWSSAVNVGSFGNNQWISSSSTPFKQQDFVVQKTHASQTVWGYSDVIASSGIYNGSESKAQATISLSAKTSYKVTYYANGGSGAPSALTKWHGESLTLSSTKPTRTGYTFVWWNTSNTATAKNAAYDGGKAYTSDSDLDLYAVWKANASAPTVTSFTAYRSTNGARDDESTTQVTFNASWTMDSGASQRSVSFKYKIGSGSETTVSVSSPAVSGSATQPVTVTLDSTARMTVTVTVADLTHSLTATRTVTIGPVFKPFHLANKGYAAAFFGIADAAWNKILCVFGSFIAEDGNIHADSTNTDSSASSISTQVDRGFYSRDKNRRTIACFYGRQSTDGKDQAVITARRYNSSANVDNSLILAVDKNGNRSVAVTDRKVWQKAIWGWNQIATTTGTTEKSFPDVQASGYTEVLVVATYTTNASYGGSVLIPVAQLSSTSRDWYLGGGYWSGGWGACCKMTLTSITPYKVRYNGTDGNGTWTVYAR